MTDAPTSALQPHEARWRIDNVRIERSRLSDSALLHRSKAGPRLVFVHQTWFGAREMAAVYFGLNTDDVTIVADERELWYERRMRAHAKHARDYIIDGWRVRPYPGAWIGHNDKPQYALFVRREGVDLVVSEPGFFDAENVPPEDEYAPRPVDVVAAKAKHRRQRKSNPKKAKSRGRR